MFRGTEVLYALSAPARHMARASGRDHDPESITAIKTLLKQTCTNFSLQTKCQLQAYYLLGQDLRVSSFMPIMMASDHVGA